MRQLLLLLLAGVASAQTTAYLRDSGDGFWVIGASNTTPIVIETGAAHGLSVGNFVGLHNIPFDRGDGDGCGNPDTFPVNVLGGNYKVKAVVDSTHFSITDLADVDVPARGTWCTAAASSVGGPQWGGKVVEYDLATGKRGWFDGDSGAWTRKLALGAENGLVSLVVSSNVATVTTTFDYVTSGIQVAVWGSANTTLNRGPSGTGSQHKGYTVTRVDSTHFTFPTSGVSDGTYTGARMLCGPAADADCLHLSRIAITGDSYWDAVMTNYTTWTGSKSVRDGGTTQLSSMVGSGATWPYIMFPSAVLTLLDSATFTSAVTDLQYVLNNIEHMMSTTWIIDPTQSNGGWSNWSDTISYLFDASAIAYAAGRGYLSSGERQTFIDKMLNDLTDAGGCERPYGRTKGGATIAFDGASTITGTGTLWQTDPDTTKRLAVGDVIFRPNWYNASVEFWVTAVNSDTSVTVVPLPASVTTFTGQSFTFHKKWATGDCGAKWFKNFWVGSWSHPALYPPNGGSAVNEPSGSKRPTRGANNGYTWTKGAMALGAAVADDDPRGVALFEQAQSFYFDYGLPYALGNRTGFTHSGGSYGFGRTTPDQERSALMLYFSVPDFPDMDMGGTWIQTPIFAKILGIEPTLRNSKYWPMPYGAQTGVNSLAGSDCGYMTSLVGRLAPTSDAARYWRSWTNTVRPTAGIGFYNLCIADEVMGMGDPSITALDYTTLPKQYLFRDTSRAALLALGKSWDEHFRNDRVISRTGWASTSDTQVILHSSTYNTDHDNVTSPSVAIFSGGNYLLGTGVLGDRLTEAHDPTRLVNLVNIGSSGSWYNNLYQGSSRLDGVNATAYIDRWSGNTPFGDSQSRYFYAETDFSGMYKVSMTRAKAHTVHFKKASTEEVVLQYMDVVPGSSTPITRMLHYPQNGQAGNGFYITQEGDTSHSGGVVTSQESGSGIEQHGLITKVLSPGTITTQWDGSSYTGNTGASYRMQVCGGGTCGGSVSSADWIEVHKITKSLSDTTLNVLALNPDANWTGVEITSTDNTAGKVALFSRGGVLRSTVTATTSHPGTAQYLVVGVQTGSAVVLRNGSPISGSPFTVSDGDNSIYWEGTAGTYTVSSDPVITLAPGDLTFACTINGTHPSQTETVGAVGVTLDQWTATAGQPWLTMTPASGSVAGTFSAQVNCDGLSAGNHSTTLTLSSSTSGVTNSPVVSNVGVTVYASPSVTTTSLPGGTKLSPYSQNVSGTGGQNPLTWEISAGALCSGLSLSSGGTISGTPTLFETCNFEVRATDAGGAIATQLLSIAVANITTPGNSMRGGLGSVSGGVVIK